MKKITIFLLIIMILLATVSTVVHVYVNAYGKDILANAIKSNLGVEAEIKELSLRFPFELQIKELEFGDIYVGSIEASLVGFNPFILQCILSEVLAENIEVQLRRNESGLVFEPFVGKEVDARRKVAQEKEKAKEPPHIKKMPLSVRVAKLELNNILVEFIDLTKEEPKKIKAYDITTRFRDFVYPQLSKFYVYFDASLETEYATMEDSIQADGWMDYSNKNMDLDINAGGISYWAFTDYYPPFWKPDSLGIKKAFLSLESNFNSKDNDLTVDLVFSVDEVEYMGVEYLEDPSRMYTIRTILEFLKGDRAKPVFSTTLKTKMDPFKLDVEVLQKSFEDAVKGARFDYMGEVIKKVKEGAEGTRKIIIEAPVEGVKSVVDAVKGIIGIITKPKETEKQEPSQN
ncbi:MAG: DUF748 domain-containing protein [Candidatus Omnitrophota bacterium]|nr:MAG: DUF748 domain-containing protein [Candidatus Omnitrophota bacterium]